jgi:hypothetical protein
MLDIKSITWGAGGFVIWRQQAPRNQSLSASGASFDRLRMSGGDCHASLAMTAKY